MSGIHEENKMGTEKMSRLIIATGVPLMLSLLINFFGLFEIPGLETLGAAIRWARIYSVLFYLGFFVMLEFFPETVLHLFNASENMLALGVPALRIFGAAFFASIPTMIFAAALQGLSRGVESMLLTTARQAVLPVAISLQLKGFGVLDLVWASFLLGELAVIPLAARVWRKARRDI